MFQDTDDKELRNEEGRPDSSITVMWNNLEPSTIRFLVQTQLSSCIQLNPETDMQAN